MNTSSTLEICSNINKILEQFGNINFLSKENLYLLIGYIRECFHIDMNEVFNISTFCKDNFKNIIIYDFHKFNDKKIGGMLVKNTFPDQSYIVVNSAKDPKSIIFDLTHEMIHFLLHPENRKHYISSSLCDIDNFEWQANEGAAELLVPYKRFIPSFVKNIKKCTSKKDYFDLLDYFADKYMVSSAVLEYRITGLKYEIYQYENGVAIDDLQFLSRTAQEEQEIYITPYSAIFRNKKTDFKSILDKFPVSHNTVDKIETAKKSSEDSTQGDYKIDNWEDIVNYFKTSGKITLYVSLLNTELLPIDDNTIGINFFKRYIFFG